MAVTAPEAQLAQLPAEDAGSSEIFSPRDDMAPIIAIGGLKSDITPWHVYSPLLAGGGDSPLATSERFKPILKGGLAGVDEMYKHLEEGLEEAYDQFGQPMVVAGQSLGGLFATKLGVNHPEKISAVVCLAGVQAGLRDWKPAARVLKRALGNPVTAEDLLEDSAHITEHKEQVASEWSPGTTLHLVSPTTDILVHTQQGLKLELPEGQEPEKRVVVPRIAVAPFVPRRMGEYGVRKALDIPDDAELIQNFWWHADHFNIATIPAVISYIRGVRREAVGYAAAAEPEPLTQPTMLKPAVAAA